MANDQELERVRYEAFCAGWAMGFKAFKTDAPPIDDIAVAQAQKGYDAYLAELKAGVIVGQKLQRG